MSLKVYHHIDVHLLGQSYPIHISENGLKDSKLLNRHVKGPQVLIVTNQTLAPLYLLYVQKAYQHLLCDVLILPDGEEYKNQESLCSIYDALIKNNHHRDTTIVALGGGVIGDLAGFAASTYQRGVDYIQIPTTLLAQVDAAVGGKTAINYHSGKNMIGSFYQPKAVIMDISTLATLPKREFCAGLAEVIKYGLLVGGDFYKQLSQHLEYGIMTSNQHFLAECIAECCRIKAVYVEQDEKEKGCRVLLNLGHTFAHALEALGAYRRWLHGEAVAIGLYCAAMLSYKLGDLSRTSLISLEKLLKNAGLDHKIPSDIDLGVLLKLMYSDKKVKNNHLNFVLIKEIGNCYLHQEINEALVLEVLELCQDPLS